MYFNFFPTYVYCTIVFVIYIGLKNINDVQIHSTQHEPNPIGTSPFLNLQPLPVSSPSIHTTGKSLLQ